MHTEIKKYIAIILLLLFLFPIAEQQLHAIDHSAYEHCTASDKHFHTIEHRCAICDFNFSTPTIIPATVAVTLNHESVFLYTYYIQKIYRTTVFQNLPVRAPPSFFS
jgi:hypothetical protein